MNQIAIYVISIFSLLETLGWSSFNATNLIGSYLNTADYTRGENIAKPQNSTKYEDPKVTNIDINNNSVLLEPIAEFKNRITKKAFGIFITPETSPVQPDRFHGYHTGVDIEYGDVIGEIPVNAIADGKVILSRFATGYGGVVAITHKIAEKDIYVIYGHLDPKSMIPLGAAAKKGEIIGYLGDDKSDETDGARKHLHFAMLKKYIVDIRGYLKTPEDLEGWYNPLDFFKNMNAAVRR